jgi:hypothetical protein
MHTAQPDGRPGSGSPAALARLHGCPGADQPAPRIAPPAHFTGKYDHRTFDVGHNVPQEAPQAFAQAVVDVDRF